MKLRPIIIVLALVIVVAAAVTWWVQPVAVTIEDASKPIELTLVSGHNANKVVALHVEGRGKVDGEAEISLMLDGRAYRTEHLNGPVHLTWRVDWYQPGAVVSYAPLTAKSGTITLRYHFATP
jgi:hypothetical protein